MAGFLITKTSDLLTRLFKHKGYRRLVVVNGPTSVAVAYVRVVSWSGEFAWLLVLWLVKLSCSVWT